MCILICSLEIDKSSAFFFYKNKNDHSHWNLDFKCIYMTSVNLWKPKQTSVLSKSLVLFFLKKCMNIFFIENG